MQTLTPVSDAEKRAVWQAYRQGKPTRVPVMSGSNPRVVLLNPEWNPHGWTFQQAGQDPEIHVKVSLQHQLYCLRCLHPFIDAPTELPEYWPVSLDVYNVYEAAFFGAPVHWYRDQVPETKPILSEDNKNDIFEHPIDRPLDNAFIQHWLQFWQQMQRVCEGMMFERRPVRLQPWALLGTDGPVTVAMNLRGSDFMLDLAADPDYADRLMGLITRAAIERRRAFLAYWGDQLAAGTGVGMADDSIAMLSPSMYRQQVLQHHRAFYDAGPSKAGRSMHLCGDATRHFPTIHQQLHVTSFDTGFPVDHGKLRESLGDSVEILGGPEVALLLSGTRDQVYERSRDILLSGVKRGGRFVLREANNLPPNVPADNLQAMCQACLDFGRYSQ